MSSKISSNLPATQDKLMDITFVQEQKKINLLENENPKNVIIQNLYHFL